MNRSSKTSSTRSDWSSRSVAPSATSPQTPSAARTIWQKPCVVVIVAVSKLPSASANLRRRSDAGTGPPSASSCTTASSAGSAAPTSRYRPRLASADTSRSRTRSLSSPVAIRVKVTTRMSDSGTPSATRRATNAATVKVLPVPALASRIVTPGPGSGPQTSKFLGPGCIRVLNARGGVHG